MLFSLLPHRDNLPGAIRSVSVDLLATADDLLLTYSVEGANLAIPRWRTSERADGLWRTTCFELFLRPDGRSRYFEFNFSPSSQWAAYQFEAYRAEMRDLPLAVNPHIETETEDEGPFSLMADLELDANIPNAALHLGLSAVIEEMDGAKSYWALAHPPGKPDFHDPACFIALLPPPSDA